jgi:hypothetical protein
MTPSCTRRWWTCKWAQLRTNPIAHAVLFAIVYVASCAIVMFANEVLSSGRELPWIWYTALWALSFAPAALMTVFAAAQTCPAWRRLCVLYAVSLIGILSTMEALYLSDGRMGTVAMAVAFLCVSIVVLFKSFEGESDANRCAN